MNVKDVEYLHDIWFFMLMSEADRLRIIDRNWYTEYLKKRLETLEFTHFAEPDAHVPVGEPRVMIVKPDPVDEMGKLMDYIERACDLLNKDVNLKTRYSSVRPFNCFVRDCKNLKPPINYVERLKRSTDLKLKSIKNVGQRTFRVLTLARDLANADNAPYSQTDLYKWSQDVLAKYEQEDNIHDAGTEEAKEH